MLGVVAAIGCMPTGDPALAAGGLRDGFHGQRLAPHWHATGKAFRVDKGKLHVERARNHPLWLARRLPDDVRISFEACSTTAEGDIKVELFGDGRSAAKRAHYVASGYVLIFGGWGNRRNVIARLDEHGGDRIEGPRRPVKPGHVYRMTVERRGSTLRWLADGKELVRMVDPQPLRGKGHDHFAFNNWNAPTWFDELVVTPL